MVAPVAPRPMVEPSLAHAATMPVSTPTLGGSGLGRLMEALRSMPLPESLKGWDQVISVEFEDRPDIWYRWSSMAIDGLFSRAKRRDPPCEW